MTRPERIRLNRIKTNLKRRAVIIDSTRRFFRREGFLEVETPLRVPVVAPELYIAPFTSEGCFLSTSPELYMKRLLAAGYRRIFQLTKSFRKGEKGKRHQPEFDILEWYRAGAGYAEVIADTERLTESVARRLHSYPTLTYQGQNIDLTLPWPRISVSEAFLKSAGWDPAKTPDEARFEEDLVNRVIPGFPKDRPVILEDYPAYCASLSRLKPGNPLVAERAEVFIAGLEIANAFSELTDAAEQEKRFRADIETLKLTRKEEYRVPRRFLEALPDMPPSGGIALGVDRLVMLFCDAKDIYDVIAFPWEEETGLEG